LLAQQDNNAVKKDSKKRHSSKQSKRKSTYEILKNKFGPDFIQPVSTVKASDPVDPSGPASPLVTRADTNSPNLQQDLTSLEHVSLQLTDHPSYTLDEEKLSSIMQISQPAVKKEDGFADADKKNHVLSEASYSQEIDLSKALPIPQMHLESWDPVVQEATFHPDAPIPPPFSYVLYNPQPHPTLDKVYWSMTNNAIPNMMGSSLIEPSCTDESVNSIHSDIISNPASQNDANVQSFEAMNNDKRNSHSTLAVNQPAAPMPINIMNTQCNSNLTCNTDSTAQGQLPQAASSQHSSFW